ncbi:hypothetical protein Goshw_016191 [Gossypium schwendimanii]|uniref:Uncharacterized protein n=1 Tax=Gossypium schwendimanii TaxID=34291 RepID=A0A7J9LGB0_GOSSC|nr:hypothetical protein [Gossypium schwendimanii]
MSLNCWTCPVLQRTNSIDDIDFGKETGISKSRCVGLNRSWSGNMSPQGYEQMGKEPSSNSSTSGIPSKKIKKGPIRFNTIATTYGTMGFEANVGAQPRLVRSSGMRRDWSLEDLRGQRVQQTGKEMSVH